MVEVKAAGFAGLQRAWLAAIEPGVMLFTVTVIQLLFAEHGTPPTVDVATRRYDVVAVTPDAS